MPAQSLIIGVDLSPIKAIPRAITFQSDITTEKCRATIRGHLKTWKADTVLHDGAPNVGTAWIQDAFTQAALVLQSMKLATEFLAPGGTFVTKVFRSKDYNSLLWVFKQLFTSVEATKPPSSRNVSAEIFVVCRGFKAPKNIDPKFLDPKHVFAELQDATPNNEAKVFNPEKKKRMREGYDEGDYTQFKELPVTEFINTTDPIAILASYNKLSFQQPISGDLAMSTLERMPETTAEVKLCAEDLKVLGKKDFRTLLRWRLKIREKFGLAVKKGPAKPEEGEGVGVGEEVTEIAPMDEELAIQEDLQRLRDQQSSKKKKERRKENERKRKEIVRMQMHMTTPMEIGMEQTGPLGEGSIFNIKPITRDGAATTIASGKMASKVSDDEESEESSGEEESDDEEDRLERELDELYENYQDRLEERDSKQRAKRARKQYEKDEWDGLSNSEEEGDDDEKDADKSAARVQPTVPKGINSDSLSNKAAMFFDQDIFHELGDLGEEEGSDSGDEIETSKPDGTEKPASAKKVQKVSKKKTQAQDDATEDWSSDGSDNERDEHGDPRTKTGQLGKSSPSTRHFFTKSKTPKKRILTLS